MAANELNETTMLDDEELNLGTSKDLKLVFDSGDNRVEFRDTSDTLRGHITGAGVFTWLGAMSAASFSTTSGVTIGTFLNIEYAGATIASGAITATKSGMKLDTEGAASSDDLDTISAGSDGDILILKTTSSSRDVVVRHLGGGTGNIRLSGAADLTLANTSSRLMLEYDSNLALWVEISHSIN